jgi:hypothetical protein
MMWLEAFLSSLLVGFAVFLLLSTPNMPSANLDPILLIQLEDNALLLLEWGSDQGPSPLQGQGIPTPLVPALVGMRDDSSLAEMAFPKSLHSFCYRWAWLDPSSSASSLNDLDFAYSPSCTSENFHNAAFIRAIEHGVWRGGRLQFLHIEQAPPKKA